MSNIYIQEPPTLGKVLLVTTVGDIDIELWAKETPKACRNFIQLCMEGYYNNTIFHRVVKGFIAQGGDPTGTGTGGESIYGQPFKDEFHSRLRFTHRGLVAMANSGPDDNSSQFFFTFAPCPELQNKNTIFGKVTGVTIYNMLKLESGEIDEDDRPVYPQKILKAEILNNPFPDIIPRSLPEKKKKEKPTVNEKKVGVKNFKLLSFGEEAEEDEEENKEVNLALAGKSKSTHDVLDDPKLSSVPAVDLVGKQFKDNEDSCNLTKVKEKLKSNSNTPKGSKILEKKQESCNEEVDKKKQKLDELRKEIRDLKKDYQKDRKHDDKKSEEGASSKSSSKSIESNEYIDNYKKNLEKYSDLKTKIPMKGRSREDFTMSLLQKFQKKLQAAKTGHEDHDSVQNESTKDSSEVNEGDKWLAHELIFEDNTPVLAKDANLKTDEWFDITDPRHAINKRRREIHKKDAKK